MRPKAQIGKLANYGWPRYEGKAVYDSSKPFNGKGQLVSPTYVYGHGGGACSVTGGYVYRGSAVAAAQGRYFFGDYCNGVIWSGHASAEGLADVRREAFTVKGLSSFGEDTAGELYATSLDSGTVYKLAP